VRDGIALARRGIPALAFVTGEFQAQGDFVAAAAGMPDLPRLCLPHPVAGSGAAAMHALAERIGDEVLVRLRGVP
jgi:hypothetical protein